MRLIELRLQNFRQHVDTAIQFRPGLTGIVGPNGAGKSTLLEGLAWAIYGSEAARGTNETLRFARAGARSRVEAELRFALAGREYRVVRSMNNAEVFLDGGVTPVATSVGGASRYLQRQLGMSRREFFNTYFTGQKELQFLATLGPSDRGRFLSNVLGYEKLRLAQELGRQRRTALRHEIEALRTGLPDADDVRRERERTDAAVVQAVEALAAAERAQAEATDALGRITPRWATAQTTRDRHRELTHAIEAAQGEREVAAHEMKRATKELERVAVAEAEREQLSEQLAPLPSVVQQCERLSLLARMNERRRSLAEQLVQLDQEMVRSGERLEKIETAPSLLTRYSAELAELRETATRLDSELEVKRADWLRDRQDAATKLQLAKDRGAELLSQITQLRERGPEGKCPTCGRAVGAEYERLIAELEEQGANAFQDLKWWKSRHDQLQPKPEEVTSLETELRAVEKQLDDRNKKHARCEAAVQELEALRLERSNRAETRARVAKEMEEIPTGYDKAEHDAADSRLRTLRGLETRAVQLAEAVKRKKEWERDLAAAKKRDAAAVARAEEVAKERDLLGFSEAAFEELRREHDLAAERRRLAELSAAEARGALTNSELAAKNAARAEQEYAERVREIALRENDHRHHGELDAALSQLRADLNAQVRPELGEIASLFLAQLTDGRYTSLEIDDEYNICVLDEGEEKPVISGGEEDVANLVLRLSLSQMIAERAGYPFTLLILDEVFGSLDVARRDNVVQLLRRLEDRFEQVILITHIDGLRENLDQIIHVAYDERTGASVVREESFNPADDPLPEEAAAD